eukprot:TRINITY_DN31398_c0_g1_i1.p1 TRINITY_DN31398_c0_g1~~TRINITY_DN31398_c0_g1_i1.p1  ORF type:complete len:755 (-),score=95.95 TRINITY_DN31398_c0_g1_i1:27-2222(-)
MQSLVPLSVPSSHIVDINVLDSSLADVNGWRESFEIAQRRAGSLVDAAFGAEHAFIVCMTGVPFFVNVEIKRDVDRHVGEPVQLNFYDKYPGSGFSLALQPLPKITRVACGIGHALLLSDQGLLYGWGTNHQGQCGVGADVPLRGKLGIVPELVCLQSWSTPASNEEEPEGGACRIGAGIPRVRMCACGPSHSGTVDINGAVWLWGSQEGIGLPILRAPASSQKHKSNATKEFLLLRHEKAGSTGKWEDQRNASTVWQRNKADAVIPPLERRTIFHARTRAVAGEQDFVMFKDNSPSMSGVGAIRKIEASPLDADGYKSEVNTPTKRAGAMTVRELLEQSLAEGPLEIVQGNRHSPTIACQLVSGNSEDMRWLTSKSLAVFPDKRAGRSAVVLPARGRFSPFAEIFLTDKNVHFLRCERNFIYSWGTADQPMLGRHCEKQNDVQPMAFARLTLFVQLSASVQTLAVGSNHVLALTCHGKVYTWGRQEACVSSDGFSRRDFSEPVIVEGALSQLRIVRIGAGRSESAVQAEGMDTLLGWELLEIAEVGKEVLPAVYQYTLTGPRFGPRSDDTRSGHLTFAHSDALQMLLVDNASPRGNGLANQHTPSSAGSGQGVKLSTPQLHGLVEPSPSTRSEPSAGGRLDADRRRAYAMRKPTTVYTKNFNQNADSKLFEWATSQQELGSQRSFDSLSPKKLSMFDVDARLTVRRREPAELDRDIAKLRYLAHKRNDRE